VWQLPAGELTPSQQFQMLSGSLSSSGKRVPLASGKLLGEQITFNVGGVEYTGRVKGDRIEGSSGSGGSRQTWTAIRRN
jgi:hypothetical protein